VIDSVPCVRNMAGHTNGTTLVTVVSTVLAVLLSKAMGAQEAHKETDILIKTVQIRENTKGQIMLREFTRKLRNHSASTRMSVRNIARMTQKVTAIQTTVHEAMGRIAQGNYICVRNVN